MTKLAFEYTILKTALHTTHLVCTSNTQIDHDKNVRGDKKKQQKNCHLITKHQKYTHSCVYI